MARTKATALAKQRARYGGDAGSSEGEDWPESGSDAPLPLGAGGSRGPPGVKAARKAAEPPFAAARSRGPPGTKAARKTAPPPLAAGGSRGPPGVAAARKSAEPPFAAARRGGLLGTKAARKSAPPPLAARGGVTKQKRGKPTAAAAARYVVTSLEEWVPDGFHSYQGPGERRTHGAYADLDEANAAAEGVFYDKNPWGWQLEDFEREGVDEGMDDAGLLQLSVHPADSTCWTVRAEPIG